MTESASFSEAPQIKLSLRLDLPHGARIGPGQIVLLEQIAKSGSLRSAAETLSMSYPKALKLIKHLNALFPQSVVELSQGGTGGGGAVLSPTGHQLIEIYRQMEAQSLSVNAVTLDRLRTLLQA